MKKINLFLVAFFTVFFISASACAFWVWTPQTKKWINPKYAAKATPQKQFDYAYGFYERKDYKNAGEEFEKLINSFPGSSLAPEAGYYGGLSYQKAELYYKAHIVYNKILTQYPHSKRTSQIIKNEYEIGEIFLSGKKRKVMGIELLPALSTAEEIFKSIVESNPYSKYGDDAQYQLGQVYKKMGNYSKAEKAFEAVIKNYPDSPLAEKARYQIALTSLESSKASEYEQKSTEKAIEGFEEFIEEEPPQELKKEAEEAISKLKDKKAKHDFDIAKYYEDNSEYKAAVIYYQSVINEYPQSIWAKKAKERIEKIEKNQNEK